MCLYHIKVFDNLQTVDQKHNYCWVNRQDTIRNTVIGTLLIDLSNGEELDKAVKAFELKVAPANYKRPKALITQSMIKNAQKKVQEPIVPGCVVLLLSKLC